MDAAADPRPARSLRWRTELWLGLGLVAAAVGLGAWIFFGGGNNPFAIDTFWNTLLAQTSSDALLGLSLAMNWLGGGWFGIIALPLIFVALLLILRRPWATLYFLSAEVVSALFVQLLKHTFGRARPGEMLVVSDFGSFPSGHVANAATIAVALLVLFPRVWVAVAGAAWVIVMAFSRTYLGVHWLSDTVGGALAGAAAALLMAALFAVLLTRERDRRMLSAPTPL